MNIALILSGGTGTRVGGNIPKQYIEVGCKPIILYALETIAKCADIDRIRIVADESWQKSIEKFMADSSEELLLRSKFIGFSAPGETRQLSIYNGLKDIAEYVADDDYVLIHDAARPCVSGKMLSDCLSAAREHDGAIPVLPMKDTVYLSENGTTISQLIDRSRIFAGQAPEAFVLGKYIAANEALMPDKIMSINGSTEPAVMAGMDIAMIPGDESNYKITTPADLERFKSEKGL